VGTAHVKSCLIVGCGYLGRRVARLLIERGEIVFGTTRSRADELTALGIRPIVADILLPETLRALPEADRVLYCVSFDRTSGHSRRSYLDGLRNVLAALKSEAKLVLASSTSVYGHRIDGLKDEETPVAPDVESERVCVEAEQIVSSRGVIVRYSGLYGPGRVIHREAIRRGEPILGYAENLISLIHIDDAAQAAVCALDRGVTSRVYLATDDQPVSRGELYGFTARLLGAPEPTFFTDESTRSGANRWFSNRRIKEELGLAFRYPTIATGLPASVADQSAGAGSM
jgi:nucleoside-diphosphate-sugar epimerase